MRLPIGTTRGLGKARLLSSERVVNLFAEEAPKDAESTVVLKSIPGLTAFASAGDGPCRMLHMMAGTLYALSGETLYAVDRDGGATSVGSVPGSGRVFAANNGTQLLMVRSDTGAGYIFNGTVTEIADADFPTATSCAFLDGFFVVSVGNSGRFMVSAAYDGTTWDTLDFATAEGDPDNLVGIAVQGAVLVLLGASSVEYWYTAGGADFPFARVSGGRVDRGCAAIGSAAVVAGGLCWLGPDGIIYRNEGYAPKRISTPAVEQMMAGWTFAQAQAFGYEQGGHAFYVLTMPEGTICWDAATGLFHERASYPAPVWRAVCCAFAYNKVLVGNGSDGAIYQVDPDAYSEGGEELRREVICAPLTDNGAQIFHGSIELLAEFGVGLVDGEGAFASGTVTLSGVPAVPSGVGIGELGVPTQFLGSTPEEIVISLRDNVEFYIQPTPGFIPDGLQARAAADGNVLKVFALEPGAGVNESTPYERTGNYIELGKGGDAGGVITLSGANLTGGSDTIPQGGAPLIGLDWSEDGGSSWSNRIFRSFGKRGEGLTRAVWNRLGRSRRRTYRLTISEPVPVTLFGLELKAEKGSQNG